MDKAFLTNYYDKKAPTRNRETALVKMIGLLSFLLFLLMSDIKDDAA